LVVQFIYPYQIFLDVPDTAAAASDFVQTCLSGYGKLVPRTVLQQVVVSSHMFTSMPYVN